MPSSPMDKSLIKMQFSLLALLMVLGTGRAVAQRNPNGNPCGSPQSDTGYFSLPGTSEDLPVGSVLHHFEFFGSHQEIITSLVGGSDYFTYDDVSRNLTVVKQLQVPPDGGEILLMLECTILRSEGSRKTNWSVIISLIDINDNPPIFTKPHYNIDLSELSAIGASVITVSATDADPTNSYITYDVVEGPYSRYFTFANPSNGLLSLNEKIDYEASPTITLTVIAKDNPLKDDAHGDNVRLQPILNSTSEIIISILDGDDQNPLFQFPDQCIGLVAEATPQGTEVGVNPALTAYDPDYGINATVKYSLIPDPVDQDDQYFDLDPDTANVTLRNSALRRGKKFSLVVQATQKDDPNRYSRSLLRIYVQPANENVPHFEQDQYTSTLVENTPIGTIVTTVAAVDNDEGCNSYFMKEEEGSQGTILFYNFETVHSKFTINKKSGVITTKDSLSIDYKDTYSLTVTVTDGNNTDTTEVVVTVLKAETQNPVMSESSYQFDGRTETGMILGSVSATDGDVGSVITFSLVDTSGLFSINPVSGEISITGDAMNINKNEYTLFVLATDNDAPPRTASAPVTVTFSDVTPGGSVQYTDTETNLVVIIILAVLLGCLLLINIILIIYIYRRLKEGEFSMRRSFQHGLDLNTDKAVHYAEVSDPEGLAYKPTARHINLYQDVQIDGDSTTTQENPFHSSDEHENRSSLYYSYDLNPEVGSSRSNRPAYTSSSIRQGFSDSDANDPTYATVVKKNNAQAMHEVNEIALAYDTAISPMDTMSEHTSSVSTINDGLPSNYPHDQMGTYRGGLSGSTQRLVTPKGSVSRNGGIDNQGLDNAAMMSAPREKPDITVYY
ncbi:hypothetical protein CAPTEDRAFT_220202 [Capitella teleta]|uniref:Cadherin domain-containing protein n=1 Tax=Capitella teleta TaxID=283909 RepID=R7T474_CAPTE|nr:hypothetical protein CAPTEDRAFT_220202 [Capitella teleta]|eukprot:ELT87727.1 hypothetical protein CAPTEDRAFT_220202 [Capitella teleta]